MRKNSVILSVAWFIVSCLPPGHPPKEQQPDADTASVEADAEIVEDQAVSPDTDAMKIEKDTAFDSVEQDISDSEVVSDEKVDVSLIETETPSTDFDAEAGTPQKDSLSDDGAPTISDDDAISPDETPIIPGKDTSADDGVYIDTDKIDTFDTVQPDTVECTEGYYYDPAKEQCVSFCGADKYFEKKVGKCLLYPCSGCDLNGQWELAVLDAESMTFTYYTMTMMQSVSYLKGQLIISSPPEVADCAGVLENSDFALSCNADEFTLALTSETANSEEISGYYSYNYKDGSFKNGACNLKKSN